MRYLVVEKLALALITAARDIHCVMTTCPLRAILHSPNLSGCLTKWAVKLSEFDIEYQVQISLKSQVLADFVVESTPEPSTTRDESEDWWTLMVDGVSNVNGSSIGV